MTRLRNLALGGLAALAVTGLASSAFAEEILSFQNRLEGATIGLPLGAAAPPGIYTGLETAYINMAGGSGTGSGNQAHINFEVPAQAVPLLWSTGWTFLGASYSMSAVFAFYLADACSINGCNKGPFGSGITNNAGPGMTTANPAWNPISLSWNLGQGWFVSTGFDFMAPIGSKFTSASFSTPNPDYWTWEWTGAVSYLANNWAASMNLFYQWNGASSGNCCGLAAAGNGYVNGQQLIGDWSILYKVGKWSLGPVGAFQVQTTNDSGAPCTSAAAKAIEVSLTGSPTVCAKETQVSFGGLVGYDFGPVDLQVWLTDHVVGDNAGCAVGCLTVWTRLGFRLWAPEAAKPLVAKN